MKNNYLYQGDYAEYDEDIGWHDFALRSYDAQLGRFWQTDPYSQFPSPYTGMGNDPINNVDPSGGWSLGGLISGITGSSNVLFNTAALAAGGALIGGIVDFATGGDGRGALIGAGIGGGLGLASGINFSGVGNISGMSIASMGVQAINFGVNVAQANNQNFTLQELITYGKGSTRFTSLLTQAGITDANYSSQISFGSETVTSPTAPYKITLKKTSLQETTLGLAHELTNRINGVALAKFTTGVGAGTITPGQYADRVLGVEAKGVMNQIVVGSQLKMQPSVAGNQPYYEEYKTGGSTEDALIKKINKNIRKINLANGKGNAYNYYKKQGAAYRKAMKAYEKQMEEYNKKYKTN